MTETLENQSTSLINEVQDFIKSHNNIHLWNWKIIIIEDNYISLKKCATEKYQDDKTIMEFIINDNNITIKEGKNSYTKPSEVQDIWNEFLKQLTSKIDWQKNKTKEALTEFFKEEE